MKKSIQASSVVLCLIGVLVYWLVGVILLSIATVCTQNEYLTVDGWRTISLFTQFIASLIGVVFVNRMHTKKLVLVVICICIGCIITSITMSVVLFDGLSNASIWNALAVLLGGLSAFVILKKRKYNVKSSKKRFHHR
jgi:hypothetical protein